MARWLLTHEHYLNVVGDHASVWEYKETDRKTKKMKRHTFPVPTHLDPNDTSQWTFKENDDTGGIVVCLEGKGQPSDIEFQGAPTPDMKPLDDEAKAITAEMSAKWDAKPSELTDSYGDFLADRFTAELSKVRADQAMNGNSVKLEGMQELLAAMTTMMQQNQLLLAELAHPRMAVEAGTARRV